MAADDSLKATVAQIRTLCGRARAQADVEVPEVSRQEVARLIAKLEPVVAELELAIGKISTEPAPFERDNYVDVGTLDAHARFLAGDE